MALKQFIYTGTITGFNIWGKSDNLPRSIISNISPLHNSYFFPKDAEKKYNESPELGLPAFFPVRKKYSLTPEGKLLLVTHYIGKELYNPQRNGNHFLHGVFTQDDILSPIAYFEDEFFKDSLSESEKKTAKMEAPLPELTKSSFDFGNVINELCEFVSTASPLKAWSVYIRAVLNALSTEKAHVCFFNADLGKEIWNFIRCINTLFPKMYATQCTFDTHFKMPNSMSLSGFDYLALNDKIVAFYNDDTSVLPSGPKALGHTYQIFDLKEEPASEDTEIYTLLCSLFSGKNAAFRVEAYRSFIDSPSTTESCLSKMQAAAALIESIPTNYSQEQTQQFINVLCAALGNEAIDSIQQDVLSLLQAALANGYDSLYELASFFKKYPVLQKAIDAAIAALITDRLLNNLSNLLFNHDEGAQNFLRFLSPLLSEKYWLLLLCKDKMQEHAKKLLLEDENAKCLHAFLSSLSPVYGKQLDAIILQLYEASQAEILTLLLQCDCETAFRKLQPFETYSSSIKKDDLLQKALDKICDNFKVITAFLNDDKAAVEQLSFFVGFEVCQKRLADYLHSYFCANEYLNQNRNVLKDCQKLEASALASIFKKWELARHYFVQNTIQLNACVLSLLREYFDALKPETLLALQKEYLAQTELLFKKDIGAIIKEKIDIDLCLHIFVRYPALEHTDKLLFVATLLQKLDDASNYLQPLFEKGIQKPFSATLLDAFLEHNQALALKLYQLYLLKNFYVAAVVDFLLQAKNNISILVENSLEEIWTYIYCGGISNTQEALAVLLPLLNKINDSLKNKFLGRFIENYGLVGLSKQTITAISEMYHQNGVLPVALTDYLGIISKKTSLHENAFRSLPPVHKQLFQSAIAYHAVKGNVSHKIKETLVKIFTPKILCEMLSYFGARDNGTLSPKTILPFLKFEQREVRAPILSFAQKYVLNPVILQKLNITHNIGRSSEKELEQFEKIVTRHALIEDPNLLRNYIHFCDNDRDYQSSSLLTSILLECNIKALPDQTYHSLIKIAETAQNVDLKFHLSVLRGLNAKQFHVCAPIQTEANACKTYFTWLTAYLSLTSKREETVLDFLCQCYGNEYIVALCELMNEQRRTMGKYNGTKNCVLFLETRKAHLLKNNSPYNT